MENAAFEEGWCLVMALWGDRYPPGYPNQIASGVVEHSPDCVDMLLLTDRIREGIDPKIRQELIPESFMKPEFFRGGYPVKLSIFTTPGVSPNTRCVFVDLDTVVLGDLGRLARMVTRHEDVLMLPPATLGFNAASRALHKLSGGKMYRTGNSSLVAFSSGAAPNIAESFLARHENPATRDAPQMKVDDRFISWFSQPHLRAVPNSIGVMLRREFLSRKSGEVARWAKDTATLKRREGLAAVTLNGLYTKPEALLDLEPGAVIDDDKGRTGIWGPDGFNPIFGRFESRLKVIVNDRAPSEDSSAP